MFAINELAPTEVFCAPVVFAFKASLPTATLASPVVIAVPVSYPINVLSVASVPVKLSPEFPPKVVLYCASDPPVI